MGQREVLTVHAFFRPVMSQSMMNVRISFVKFIMSGYNNFKLLQ